jgi:hypothetical protein
MLVGVAVGLVEAIVGGPVLAGLGVFRQLLLLTVGEAIAFSLGKLTPGYWLLGISLRSLQNAAAGAQRVPLVDPVLKERETWYTIALAVLFLNDGLKGLIRWSMWDTSAPYFGVLLDGFASAVLSIAFGALACMVAYCLFRVDRRAVWLGAPYLLLSITSAVMSWDLWDSWVAEATVRRRAWQGLPVREGEVEFMQALFPEFAIVLPVIYVAALVVASRRLLMVGDATAVA